MRSVETYRAQAVVRELTASSKPGSAIRALAGKAGDASVSPFERYAGTVLCEAGTLELADQAISEIRLFQMPRGNLVRMTAPAGIGVSEDSVLLLENALNRLTGIVSALQQGIGAQNPNGVPYARARRQKLFASYGVDYPLWSDTDRGTHVALPQLASTEKPSDTYFNEIDWRMLDTVANNAHVFFQAAILTNLNQVIYGVKAPHCSEWDVRTRLASILGGLETSLRFSYKFDCDTGNNTAIVHFTVPEEASFPAIPCEEDGTIRDARSVYALRMAALLGAACFGSGRIIDHALVVGGDGRGRAHVSCAFERVAFVHETLPTIDSGAFADPALRFNPKRIAQLLGAAHVEYATGDSPPLATGQLAGMRANPWEDERELPADLQGLFHAKRASAIDTSHYLGDAADVIDEAKSDSADSIVAAIAQLEHVVADLESHLEPPHDQPDARPLYCGHALARAAVALLNDELNVANEAETFLGAAPGNDDGMLPDVYYYRAPDALFHAHVGLADLYRKLGDVRGAEEQADRCIALAPTTPAGYAMKADALAGQGRYKEGVNVLMAGLRTAIAENDQALLLHDLAQLFWRMGRSREASALHIYTATLPGLYAKKSLEFARQLADGENVHEFIRANAQEAAQVIRAAGIPLVPERVCQRIIAQAALGLANARMPRVAAPYIAELAKRFPTNRAVIEACNSIRYGID